MKGLSATLNPEIQLKVLFILALDGLLPWWDDMCLRIDSSSHSTVHFSAQQSLLKKFTEVGHISELRDPQSIIDAFSSFENDVLQGSPRASIEVSRWAYCLIADERQSTADWRCRMFFLDLASDQELFNRISEISSSPAELEVLVQVFRRQIQTPKFDAIKLLEALTAQDLEILTKERLSLGDSFIYPTLELVGETVSRVDFLQVWKNVVSLLPERGILLIQQLLRKRWDILPSADTPIVPNLGVCPSIYS